jgi:hypothetical protein
LICGLWNGTPNSPEAPGLFYDFRIRLGQRFVQVYDRADDVLRFALMEKAMADLQKQAAQIDKIRRRRTRWFRSATKWR